jgi:shikimate dehydrogenase
MTRKFGLIGYPLTHSFSKKYFTERFAEEGIDAVYNNYPISSIMAFRALQCTEDLEGINVTIPYKEQVIPYLDQVSTAVKEIGACNCIQYKEGIWTGHNTDVIGFEQSLLKHLHSSHHSALVLGTGGAAKAVWYVLRKLGIPFIKVSRTSGNDTVTYESLTDETIATHPLIINTTPLGMFPNVDEYPNIPFGAIGQGHYLYDLVYNPGVTKFLEKGAAQGATIANGEDMLVIQANESRRIWGL